MKKLLAYIFLIIFSTQVLPVKEIGKILYKGQITEEEVHTCSEGCEDSNALKLKIEGDPFHHTERQLFQAHARVAFLTQQINTAIHHAEHIPIHFVPDILTPPPNYS